jgi:hypothetical protein
MAANLANLSNLLSSTTLTDTASNDISWLRYSSNDIRSIRSLPSKANIGLFTPAITPPPGSPGANVDPFEPFGRAMGNFQQNIRHVPYVPAAGQGLIDVHTKLAPSCSVIVVFICVVEAGQGTMSGVRCQVKFAEDLAKWVKSWNLRMPLVLVKMGATGASLHVDGYSSEMACRAYSLGTLDRIAGAIFKG